MDADAKMCLARDSVWRLLRVMLLQASDQVTLNPEPCTLNPEP